MGALVAAALGAPWAGADVPVSYGVAVSKGCESPTKVGAEFFCTYQLSNTASTSKETVVVTAAADDADRRPGEDGTTNILPELALTIHETAAAAPGSQASCNAVQGDGVATPYTGVTSCTLPFGWFIASADFGLGLVTQADVDATANTDPPYTLNDQITFTWHNLCDVTFDTCSTDDSIGQAASGTRLIAVPSLTTNALPADGAIPLILTDVAHLTATTKDAGGTITFQLYDVGQIGGAVCDPSTAIGGPLTVPVQGPGNYTSPGVPIGLVKSYGWTASYSGDLNNVAVGPVGCADPAEHSGTEPAVTSLTTVAASPSPAGVLPAAVSDVAKLTIPDLPGVVVPITGTVTFHLYSDASCKSEVAGSPVIATVAANATGPTVFVTSPSIIVHDVGTYHWQARYSGDQNNSPAPGVSALNPSGLTDCADPNEAVVVPPPPLTMTTTASSATSIPAQLTDTAHITTGNANANGKLTFSLYSDSKCTLAVGSPVTAQVTADKFVNGVGDFVSPAITVSANGMYFWRVEFTGDTNTGHVGPTPCGDAGEISQVSGATGQIELCKAPDNGAAGNMFTFTLTNLTSGATQTVQVRGGTCSQAITVFTGRWQVTEDLSSGLWTVSGIRVIPAVYWLSENDGAGTVKVKVVKGDETQVTFTDTPAPAVIKVCKYSGTSSLQGRQFSFTLLNTTVVAKAGATQATAGCSTAVPVDAGATFNVTEAVPAGEQVAKVAVGGSNTKLNGTSGGGANITAGPGVNVIYFDNEASAPAQAGFVEICKDAGDAFVAAATTPFAFTVTDRNGVTQKANVLPGQCSAALEVQAGTTTIAEAATSGLQVTAVTAAPATALGTVNLINGTAVINVPVSATPAGQVEVHVTNSTVVTQLKVCKLLGPDSDALAGQTFAFTVTDDAYPAGTSFPVSVVATTTGACSIVQQRNASGQLVDVAFPVGSKATITEAEPSTFINGDNAGPGANDVQTKTIAAGINEVDFTNQALGQLEICKDMTDSPGSSFKGTPFTFTYQGIEFPKIKATVTVAAEACSPPQVVPVGRYTITETSIPLGFSFASATATGPTGDSRVLAGGNPVTVTVPFFDAPIPKGGETDVHFVDAAQSVSVKVCKVIDGASQGALGGLPYSFTLTNVTLQTAVGTQSTSGPYADAGGDPSKAGPNSCVVFNGLPLVDPATGNAYKYRVREKAGTTYVNTNIAPSGPVTVTNNSPSTGTVAFTFSGPGGATFVYTNASP